MSNDYFNTNSTIIPNPNEQLHADYIRQQTQQLLIKQNQLRSSDTNKLKNQNRVHSIQNLDKSCHSFGPAVYRASDIRKSQTSLHAGSQTLPKPRSVQSVTHTVNGNYNSNNNNNNMVSTFNNQTMNTNTNAHTHETNSNPNKILGPAPSFMTPSIFNVSVVAKIYLGSEKLTLTVDSNWTCEEFFQKLRRVARCNESGPLTVKWLDDEDDPCTISTQLEYDEAIRYVIKSKHLELLKLHIFNGEPKHPGNRAPGETKDMYRKNARRLNKLRRIFQIQRKQKPPIQSSNLGIDNPMLRNNSNSGFGSQPSITDIGAMVNSNPALSNRVGNHNHNNSSVNSSSHHNNNQHNNTNINSKDQNQLTTPSTQTFGLVDFDLMKVIGRGSFSKVLLVKLKSTKQLYAMKVIKKELIADEEDVDWVNTEKKVFEQATNHPFLVGMHSCFQTEARLFFVIEFVNGGDLMFHMQKQRKLPEDHARFYSAEIVLALTFLHSRFIIYRDLKLDNVLLDSQGHIKLTDYGMCKDGMVGENAVTYTFCGTPNYIAPEILQYSAYSFSVDWWALGVLMYEMMAGKSPFDLTGIVNEDCNNTEEALFQVILERPIRLPRFLSLPAQRVLKRFLDKDPKTRLGCSKEGFQETKKDPFFKSLDWERLENRQVIPPFKPSIKDEQGLENFDTNFTEEPPELTPVNSEILGKINQNDFEDFAYNNPLLLNGGLAC